MRTAILFFSVILSLNSFAQTSYFYELKKNFNQSLPVTKVEVVNFVNHPDRKCYYASEEELVGSLEIEAKEFVLPGAGPMFPEKRFTRIISGIEKPKVKSPAVAYRDMSENDHDQGFAVGFKQNDVKVVTQYRLSEHYLTFHITHEEVFDIGDYSACTIDNHWGDDDCFYTETEYYGYCHL
jgi:hypothetical protein